MLRMTAGVLFVVGIILVAVNAAASRRKKRRIASGRLLDGMGLYRMLHGEEDGETVARIDREARSRVAHEIPMNRIMVGVGIGIIAGAILLWAFSRS